MSDRKDVSHIVKTDFSPVEEILRDTLGAKFGERFLRYREEYRRSLRAGEDGHVAAFPTTLTIELVNRCNLSCVMCYTTHHKGTKYTLGLDQIRDCLAECKEHGLPAVLIGANAEALLYKDIREVLKAVRDAGVMDIFLITNGTLLTEELSRFLVENEISRVLISLDAATPETYQKVRGKDELGRVEANIHSLLKVKKDLGRQLPIVRLSFCVQEVNRTEQEAFREKWHGLVDSIDFQVLSDFSYLNELLETGTVARTRLPMDFGEQKPFCHHPFGYLNIWANGDISPCCVYYGKKLIFGNIRDTTLLEVWNGEPMRALREEFMTGNLNIVCKTCLSQRENLISPSIAAF